MNIIIINPVALKVQKKFVSPILFFYTLRTMY